MYQISESSICERMKQVRKDAGYSRRQVEEALSLRFNTLYDIESGRLNLHYALALRLANHYRCGIDAFAVKVDDLPTDSQEEVETTTNPTVGVLHTAGVIGSSHPIATMMAQDPVIVAEVGVASMGTKPLMQLMMDALTERQARDFVLEIYRYVNALISVDGRITDTELSLRNALMQQSSITLNTAERQSVSKAFGRRYLGKSYKKYFPREAHKHFLIWLLFLLADDEEQPDYKEFEYITQVAEHIELSKSSFVYIESQVRSLFVKGV